MPWSGLVLALALGLPGQVAGAPIGVPAGAALDPRPSLALRAVAIEAAEALRGYDPPPPPPPPLAIVPSRTASPRDSTGWRSQEGTTYLVVVSGVGGEEKYRGWFHEWGLGLVKAAVDKHGLPRANVTYLAEQPERDAQWIAGKATKEEVEKTLVSLSGKARGGDQVFIVLIGHGSFQSGDSRFNLVGPDMSATDFALLLDGFEGARVAFVNTGSASGEFTKVLSGENRIVVTATKSGQERNESVFGKYFTEAYAGDASDTDKDGRVSLLEAFEYARLQVQREYQQDNRILTEHAVLDDNGDKTGSTEPVPAKGDGTLARAMFLGRGAGVASAAPANASPALRALYEEKRVLEQRIEDLKALKSTMAAEAYERELEKLLIELAEKNEAIRKAGGRSF